MSPWQPVVQEIVGRFAGASNATLLGRAAGTLVVYKPLAGNRPLWDFDPATLAAREVLTYRLAQALGFDHVPETAFGDGPLGPGAVQRFVEQDPDFDGVAMIRQADPALWPIAVLDLIANNADRKVGHLLLERGSGTLRAIDHGLTFHPEPKLRTVLWVFAGRPLPPPMATAVGGLERDLDPVATFATQHLGSAEAAALADRVVTLAAEGVHPHPPDDRPPLPWPPY